MKFVVAPDSFKESATSIEICDTIEAAIKSIMKEAVVIKVPMADGGEGTLDALMTQSSAKIMSVATTDALGNNINANYGLLTNAGKVTAIIEVAQVVGLNMTKREERLPTKATTYGLGAVIIDALKHNPNEIIVGLGGSSTTDGGAGMLQALGLQLLDKDGKEVAKGGEYLLNVDKVIVDNLIKIPEHIKITIASDVTNPLCGELGSAKIFSRQKGATDTEIELLDSALTNYANKSAQALNTLTSSNTKDGSINYHDKPGAGAAGGLGYAFMAYLGARMLPGIEVIMEATSLASKIDKGDIVITGEGRIDNQSAYGKTPVGVAKLAKSKGAVVIAICGSEGERYEEVFNHGIDAVFPILTKIETLDQALMNAKHNIYHTTQNIIRMIDTMNYVRK